VTTAEGTGESWGSPLQSCAADVGDRLSIYVQMLDAVGEAVIATDLDGTVVYWNAAAEGLYGYRREDALGRQIADLTVADTSREQGIEIMAAVAAGRAWTGEFTVRDRAGRTFHARVTDAPIRDAAGEIVGIIGISRDITEENDARAAAEESAELFRRVFDDVPVAKVLVGPDLEIRRVNEAFCTTLGYTAEEVLGLGWNAFTHPDDLAAEEELSALLLTGEVDSYRIGKRLLDKAGNVVHTVLSASLVRDASGDAWYGIGMYQDVTAERDAEDRRQEAYRASRAVIEASVDAFVGMDAAGHITDWNIAAQEMFGWSAHDVLGTPLADRIVPADQRTRHLDGVRRWLAGGDVGALPRGRRELTAVRRDGSAFPVEVAVTAVTEGGEVRFKAFVRDITKRKRYEEELARRAVTDPLTGLANRRYFVSQLDAALDRLDRRDGTVAVLFIDLDRFKVINDSLGHAAGDRLLVALADRMRQVLRPTDTLARFGGDEFALVCEDLGGERDAAALADRLLEVLRQKVYLDGRGVVVDVSIGIALTSSAEGPAEDLLRDADAAMYRAKGRGGGLWELFDEELRAHAVARLDLEDALRRALEEGELRVFYQPVTTLDERPVSAEALVRWQHPAHGLISPADFIPIAEETGLIVPLGQFVLEEACRQLAEWRRSDPALAELTIAVNLSARQLADPGLPERVCEVLTANGLDPSVLCLEITESVLMDDVGTPANSLLALHELGVQLAVDDFGTGYSSLLSLRRFPVQVLKLDRSFVSGLGRNERDTAIVGSVIQLAHALGLVAVAEGVETEAQLEALVSLGCDRAQGYLWSPPVPPDAARDLLAVHRCPRAVPRG
jgi:diguanylate cyclase (GGDEF)-like protein/PAS domain S-box-containing protein